MRDAGGGSFISIGSVADHTGFPENAAYAASKYGLRGLHETLAAEYRGTGVRLMLVSPGATDTTIWDPFAPESRARLPLARRDAPARGCRGRRDLRRHSSGARPRGLDPAPTLRTGRVRADTTRHLMTAFHRIVISALARR